MNSILQLPSDLKTYFKYKDNEDIPFWILGCIKDSNKTKISHFFDKSIEVHNLDKASTKAINEFIFNSFDVDRILRDYSFDFKISEDISKSSLPSDLKNALLSNGICNLLDLNNYNPEQLLKLPRIGKRKVFNIILNIPNNYMNNETEEKELVGKIDLEHSNKIFSNYENSDLILYDFFDPRFLKFKNKILSYLNDGSFEKLSWYEVFDLAKITTPTKIYSALIEEVNSKCIEIEEKTLGDQIKSLLSDCNEMSTSKIISEKYFSLILDRLGLIEGIHKIPTLNEQGIKANVTRERIRQVERKFLQKIKNYDIGTFFIPGLIKTKEILSENAYSSESILRGILLKKGIGKWSLKRIIMCFDFFEIPHNFLVENNTLIFEKDKNLTKTILMISKKIISYNGLLEINHLLEVLTRDFKFHVKLPALKSILDEHYSEVSEGWYFFKETTKDSKRLYRTKLFRLARSISNFSKNFSSSDLREAHIKYATLRTKGFRKTYTYFYDFITPSTEAIQSLFSTSKGCNVNGNIISLNYVIDDDELEESDDSTADEMFLDYFKARNFQTATIDELNEYFVKSKKMAQGSLLQYLSYKPYLKRFKREVYGIVGSSPSETELDNSRKRIKRKNPPKIGWNESGKLVIKAEVKNVSSFVFQLTEDLSKFILNDEFKVMEGQLEVGALKRSADSGFWFGLGPYLYKLKCEIEDFITIELDLKENTAIAYKISSDEYFD